jgi:serine protease Do
MTVSMMAPGTTVNLKVLREGSSRNVTATLGELPTEQATAEKQQTDSKSELSGLSVQDLDARTARQLGVPANVSGVVVTKVDPSSAAAESGIERGDVIQEVNHKPVRNTSDFESAMQNSKDQTLLLVNRQGNTLYVAV